MDWEKEMGAEGNLPGKILYTAKFNDFKHLV